MKIVKINLKIANDNFDCETDSYERNMGSEISYLFYATIKCPECFNEIDLKINSWEYPIGALNYSDFEISGGTYLQKPSVSVDFEYYFDYEIVEEELPKVIQILFE
ncbi:hypothetical protein KUV80_00260 [Fictibacillus nanhaiensis]|uniref:hypothetical protein n=1 Tax=Fictibacillus nanhaiensis TaxID=742169 RepID=UPI001C95EE25|nr:hypothetical protein [Fictibacillus nanhaiensis]MBY6035064.1 hypothetical protein [Fictibacillus nanhaiensis]